MATVPETIKISSEFLHDRTVNYAMQQNHVPVIKRLRLTNSGDGDIGQLAVKVIAEPEFAEVWEMTVAMLPAGQTIDLGTVDLQLSPVFLAGLRERLAGRLSLKVFQDQEVLYSVQSPIDLLAYDEWAGSQNLLEMIAAFVAPNHPEIMRILRKAADILQEWTGSPSLNGYQSKDPQRVRKQLAAIYTVIKAQQIAYCVPPASFEENGQKIRTPEVICEHRLGTCLDLTVLFAACAEAAGLHPIIIFTQGHAFPGVWLVEESFAESIQDDVTLLTKRIAPGVSEICVFESTAATSGQDCSFDDAVALGEGHLRDADQFIFLVDVRRARGSQIRPLPLRVDSRLSDDRFEDTEATSEIAAQIPADMELPIETTIETELGGARSRLEQWERRLLDLSLRNPLLNFRVTGRSIPMLTAELSDLEDALADGQDFPIYPRPLDWDDSRRDVRVYQRRHKTDPKMQLLREEFSQGRLRADLPEKELSTRLTQVYRAARTSLEENGANTLYLAFGLLVWYETEASEKTRYAPILLIPMEIMRKSVQTGYRVRQGEDEPQLNITLMEMLRQDFGINISGLNPLPTDEHGVDVKKILNIIRRAVMSRSRWDVIEDAYLGLFSFSKFVMWHDLKTRSEDLKRNKVVASLIAGNLQWLPDNDGPVADELDTRYHPKDIFCPISADSSQLTAICLAGEGKSIVLHGPPGTGKSQTITNIIAHAVAQGKSVLFVAEKMAALTVVQRRLAQIGLSPFCLEVHSNKSKKKDVLEQLRISLEINRTNNPQNWEQEAKRLAALREELNAYVQSLHQQRRIGHSIFLGLARLAAVRHSPAVVKFKPEQVQNLTPELLQQWIDLTRQLRVAGQDCGHPFQHAWTASRRQDYIPQMHTQAADALTALRYAIDNWQKAASPVVKLLLLTDSEPGYLELTTLSELSKLLLNMPTVPGTMVRIREWDDTRKVIEEWIAHGRVRDDLRTEAFARYTEGCMQLDIPTLQGDLRLTGQQWFLPRFLGRNRVLKTLRRVLRPGNKLKADQLETELMQLQRLHEEEAVLSNASDRARELLGGLWQEGNADWELLANVCEWTSSVRKLLIVIAGTDLTRMEALRENWACLVNDYREQLSPEGTLGQQLQIFVEGGEPFTIAWNTLRQLADMDENALVEDQSAPGFFMTSLARVNQWETNLDYLRDWCAWLRVRAEAIEAGLLPVVTPYEQGQLIHDEVESAFTRGLYQTWAEHEISQDKVLASFSRGLFEDKIRQFRELDDAYAQLTRDEIYARLAARVPHSQGDAAQNSEMGILQREIQKQRNHMALRTLFQKIPRLLTRLKPCLLMSPISVAQYLDPAHPPFDLVIFDEASQVPTCDAVGSIARGKEVFIVGDPKQLPPTNFFSSMNNEEDEEGLAIQDLESILDDCLAIRMPEERLRWHYRSKHESLINFSNYQYYDNTLYTFPSPDDLTPVVHLYPVDGVYDRGKSKQNRAEAEAVVTEVLRRLRDSELCKRSIGVVTFSQVQQRLIEDLLDEQIREAPELESYFSVSANEPVFVKNLENVQGDERDVILFSIGYGPDALGRVSMNFGPLNKEGGWRRLNVAVSRARQEMLIFSTLRPEQLDTSRTNAKGVADLKAFLEYAQRGKQTLYAQYTQTTNAEHDSIFEEQVCLALQEKGYSVQPQVGCSGYRIDLAVVDCDHPGRYILGIECDGATYHRSKTARDRDKLREMVLSQLGWQIHRVWSTDWWENPQREIKRLEDSIALAHKQAQATAVVATPSPLIARVVTAPAEADPEAKQSKAGIPYVPCRLSPVTGPQDEFYQQSTTRMVMEQIIKVVNIEGPISYGLLCRRIVQVWGMTRVGSRIDVRISEICTKSKLRTTKTGEFTYYWPQNTDPAQYTSFRVPNQEMQTRRDIEDIPREETKNASLEVLHQQIGLPESDLIREVARLFGFQHLGARNQQHIGRGIVLLLKSGAAKRDKEGRIVLDK